MTSQLTRTFLFNSRFIQINVQRTIASQSQSSQGPMEFIRQGVNRLKNVFTNEDPTIEKAAQDFKEIANQSNEAKNSSSSQSTNTSGTHAPAAQRETLRTAGGRATTQSRNYSTSSSSKKENEGNGGYAGSSKASDNYSSGTRGTEESGPVKQPSGGYVDRDAKTTDKTKDRKSPPLS